MLLVALVFIREHSFKPVRLMLGDEQTSAFSGMSDQKLFAAALATHGSHRLESFWHLRLELPFLDRDRICHYGEYNEDARARRF
jgi:hypothetical protein